MQSLACNDATACQHNNRPAAHCPPLAAQPYAVHATFQFAGTPGKRHRLRESMLFEDPPDYFDHPVGFISFAVRLNVLMMLPVIRLPHSFMGFISFAIRLNPHSFNVFVLAAA
jgi:hypothetical protein